ncbi:protein SOB FIVE-LIKE 6-like [Dioscorea cayenensis subsp. rotundata]|uniref:Protein SOB FIVE-LIKE 6-like n=1 Tax=Dioscorea cayennensis subsp. rotundata TaxID=55577 RepID=A0AB40AJU6_DIOCR|nr:protein SOB FIVE-LIKE 6-like [Dioscorea cayenensis subsp. rotundata]
MWRMESWEEMEEDGSECSSGCQSGWTMYLDQSYEKHHLLPFGKAGTQLEHEDEGEDEDDDEEEEEEEEDLSMVSDASSGPPHLHEEDYHHCCCCSSSLMVDKSGGKRKRVGEKKHQELNKHEDFSSFLDDTASSPLLSFPESGFNGSISRSINPPAIDGVLEFSSCFSATHFKL